MRRHPSLGAAGHHEAYVFGGCAELLLQHQHEGLGRESARKIVDVSIAFGLAENRDDEFLLALAHVGSKAGRAWALAGAFGDIRFGYLDMTSDLGHYVEVMELGPRAAAYFASIEAASRQTGRSDRPAPDAPS